MTNVLNRLSLIPYMGGKNRMASKILPIIAQAERLSYIEPFGGSAAILLRKPKEPNETYNDINGLLANLFTVLRKKENVEAFQRIALTAPHSRAIWHSMREIALAFAAREPLEEAKDKYGLTDYSDEVAAAFAYFYCMRCGFAGKPDMSAYGAVRAVFRNGRLHNAHARLYTHTTDELATFQERLKGVQVEQNAFQECFRLYDTETALFYCDPPYDVDCSKTYDGEWNKDSSKELVEICARAKGSVVLSCYDSPIYEELLKAGYERRQWKSYQSVCKTKRGARVETVYFRFRKRKGEGDASLICLP